MRITEKQLMGLLVVLKDTCSIESNLFGFTAAQRLALYNQILHQQSDEVVEISKLETKKEEE